jgi:hypothetical protein
MKKVIKLIICTGLLSFILFACITACTTNQSEDVNLKDNTTDNQEKVEITPKDNTKDTIGGLDIKIIDSSFVKSDVLGIKLKLENKTNDALYPVGCFSCMDIEKNVLDQEYPIEENLSKQDIINLDNLPEGAKWEGFIYFKTQKKKVTLIYDDMLGNKKKFNITIK